MVARVVARAARNSRGAVAVAALIVAAAVLAGCARRPLLSTRAPELRPGYAYTAVLVTRHPLYAALVDLETALTDLGDGEWEPVLPPMETRLATELLAERLSIGDPVEQIATLHTHWRESYPELQLPGDALTQDLQARIDWEQRWSDSTIAARMAQAEAQEGRRLAQLRAALVRQYQERLSNLRIDEVLGDETAAERARAERERVWQAIEAQLEAERAAGREALAGLERRLREQAQERLRTVGARAEAVAARRSETMAVAGAGLYDDMLAALSAPWPEPAIEEVELRGEAGATDQRLGTAEESRRQAGAARSEAIEQQQRRLLRALGRLRAQLKSETETAAHVVAYRDGIDLTLLPGGPPRGDDLTSSMARKLEAFWREAGRQRS